MEVGKCQRIVLEHDYLLEQILQQLYCPIIADGDVDNDSDSELDLEEDKPCFSDEYLIDFFCGKRISDWPYSHAFDLFHCLTVSKHWFLIAATCLWKRYSSIDELVPFLEPFSSTSNQVSQFGVIHFTF